MQYLIAGNELLASKPDFKLIGRLAELNKICSVLIRSSAASLIVVGPGGVGISSLVLALQAIKQDDTATFDIVAKRLFWLKVDELFASGNQEEINKGWTQVLAILKRTPDSILVIEDSRAFIEAARANGVPHLLNSLNATVKSKHTQVIFETNNTDVDFVIGSHPDMQQIYTLLDIAEPVFNELLDISRHSAKQLEEHHDIAITEEAILAAVDLTTRYRTKDASLSRAQPERTRNLLDRALSTFRLDAHKQHPDVRALLAAGTPADDPQIVALNEEFSKLQVKMKRLHKEQRDAEVEIINLEEQLAAVIAEEKANPPAEGSDEPATKRLAMFSSFAKSGGFDSVKVTELKRLIKGFQNAADAAREEFDRLTADINSKLKLTKAHVDAEFSRLSGYSVDKLNEDESKKLLSLEDDLNGWVLGQTEAVVAVANAVKVARVKMKKVASKKPVSFMFLGPSGVGKTELSKALADKLGMEMTRFDMGEFMEKHAVAKLIGAPPGYDGFDQGGILTNASRRNPTQIFLFDEVEKAHPDVFDVLLAIIDDGRCTDNIGRVCDFKNAIVILTTNVGQPFFLDESLEWEAAKASAYAELDTKFRSEFLNRFNGRQNILCFNRLPLPVIEKITKRNVEKVVEIYSEPDFNLGTVDQQMIVDLCGDRYIMREGARGLAGFVEANLEPIIVNKILAGTANGSVQLDYDLSTRNFTVTELAA